MKPDTKIWLKCESIGRPADGFTLNCSTREAIKSMAEWLMGTYMGSKIRITLARTEEELTENRKSNNVADMMADLDSIINPMGGTPETDSSTHCRHGIETSSGCPDCMTERVVAEQRS